jgi:adenylosuccinate synthase
VLHLFRAEYCVVCAAEYKNLKQHQFVRCIAAHQACKVSTIYDMAANAMAETARTARHGSCGLGINETVTRHNTSVKFSFSDICVQSHEFAPARDDRVRQRFDDIYHYYQSRIIDILKGSAYSKELETYMKILNMSPVEAADKFLDALFDSNFQWHYPLLPKAVDNNYVFEGAQGLMLDEFMGEFPHVTRSMTGLPFALLAAKELGLKEITPQYVTRCYTTRHGAGNLAGESHPEGLVMNDPTNVPGEWQGTLRYAPLHLDLLRKFISDDLDRGKNIADALGIKLMKPRIAITCLDQFPDEIPVWYRDSETGNTHKSLSKKSNFISIVERYSRCRVSHLSYGPSAKDVKYLL